jgi:hypothetical protein
MRTGCQAWTASKRQLCGLLNDLRLLDRDAAQIPASSAPGILDRMLAASNSALRDSCYEAAMLLMPSRRRA